jgi:class 3 adenylate cyclase
VAEGSAQRRAPRLLRRAQELNRSPALVERATRVRAWALGDDELVDRLSTARGRPADVAARQLQALRGERPGLLGEVGMTALQAWQRLAESQGRGRGELDVAILFTDLVDFSSWMLDSGDRHALALLRELSDAIEPPIVERRGEIVKRLGDGLMGAFWDASSALEAASQAHERVAAIEFDGYRPQLRTGIHLGRPRKVGGDYLGVDVNIAARIAESAQPDEILISERSYLALGAPGPIVSEPRPLSAKGVPEGFSVRSVLAASAARPAPARAGRDRDGAP